MREKTREKILKAKDIKEKEVEISEWDVKILVKGLNGKQRAMLMDAITDVKGKIDFQKLTSELVILTACDPESKEQLFEISDRDAILEKSGAALDKVLKVAMELSGISATSETEAEKNLGILKDSSTSILPNS